MTKLQPHDLVAGQLYKGADGHFWTYKGVDVFHGETTLEFRSGALCGRYIFPHQLDAFLAPREAVTVIDLDKADWEALCKAATESSWMPPEYMRNEWVSDCCRFLREGPSTFAVSAAPAKPKGALCYIQRYDGYRAFFTTAPLDKQWGDDWNDAPYEHNAGAPYPVEGFELGYVDFDPGDMITPAEGHCNSPWSVEQINRGEVPWLRNGSVNIVTAGATFDEFQAALKRAGGTALMPWPEPTEDDAISITESTEPGTQFVTKVASGDWVKSTFKGFVKDRQEGLEYHALVFGLDEAGGAPFTVESTISGGTIEHRFVESLPDETPAATSARFLRDVVFLNWIADRLVHVYGEHPNVDFVLRLREMAEEAAAKALGIDALKALLMRGEFSSMSISCNDHAVNYISASREIIENSFGRFDDKNFTSPEEKQRCADTNTIWTLQWYPDTPVGFYVVHASTFEAIAAWVRKNVESTDAPNPTP